MPEVTCDYSVPMTVRVNTDTGEVLSVWLHLESFQASPRGRFTRPGETLAVAVDEVYFRNAFLNTDDAQGEFCDGEHPLADAALAIGDRVSVVNPEFELRFTVDE